MFVRFDFFPIQIAKVHSKDSKSTLLLHAKYHQIVKNLTCSELLKWF